MEAKERRRSAGSSRTSKKAGGKQLRALTEEEEARRRAAITETLQDKLRLEKEAVQVVESLLEDSVSEDFLLQCANSITPAYYKDAVEERSIAKLCGYPICPNKPGKVPSQQYRISTKTNKVYDITERKCFCSNFCYKASKEFELQIAKTPLWLRQHESPPEIRLMKKGDGGSSGEEVRLTERRILEDDIENPPAAPAEDPGSSPAAALSPGDGSGDEQEQDFVSSVVSRREGPRVHWGDLPKRTDGDGEAGEAQKTAFVGKSEQRADTKSPGGESAFEGSHEAGAEEVSEKLNLCSLHSAPEADHTPPLTSPPLTQAGLPSEVGSGAEPQSSAPANNIKASAGPPGLDVVQVGMSKRGAAGLRGLLAARPGPQPGPQPGSVRLWMLQSLRRTMEEWVTDETLSFLYGADRQLNSAAAANAKKEGAAAAEEEEELDEDDLEDVVTPEEGGEQQREEAPPPDYAALRRETQQLVIRVKEFYKGSLTVPEEGGKVAAQDRSAKDAILPLVDSHAQHIIQKRITMEKLSGRLKDVVEPLGLSMSDFTTDLNNLLRTFRFTNTNIIHKTPEWTLIAVLLLHLLSNVSPVVREALDKPASVQHLDMRLEELGLQQEDLLNLVHHYKPKEH